MTASASHSLLHEIPGLLRGESRIKTGAAEWETPRALLYVTVIILGAGAYGAAMGAWRDPMQALYTAIKFPLVILLTTFGNALLNAMLAPLLGLNISVRQSFMAVLMSFTIASAIIGALSPVMLFLVWNTPPMAGVTPVSLTTHRAILLLQVGVIAFAGIVANVRLLDLLRQLSGSHDVARRIMFAWLACNLFLGSQLTWILRPFIGAPFLPVQFLRSNAFEGNFYETVFQSIRHFLTE